MRTAFPGYFLVQLREANVDSIQSFAAFFEAESNLVVFADLIFRSGDVYEYFFAGSFNRDESKAFRVIKEFYSSVFHLNFDLFDN